MAHKCSIFPIERVAHNWIGVEDDNFDATILPFKIVESVHVEDVSGLIREGEFRYCREMLGSETVKHLENIKYAIVHRFTSPARDPKTGGLILEPELEEQSRLLVQEIVACLRIIRPVVQHGQFLGGTIAGDGMFEHFHFDHPISFLSPLPIQKLMRIRTEDLISLRKYAPLFIAAMDGNYWKYRMAVDMFQSGFFQETHWKLRYFMWTAALEALFASHTSPEHRGGHVVKERIKWLLGPTTPIYPPHELTQWDPDPKLTVEDVLDEIYCLRNHIAHGDRVPDYYFQTSARQNITGSVTKGDVLCESICSIVRQCLLAILDRNLLPHFENDAAAEAHFSSLGLTNASLKRGTIKFRCPS